MNRYKSAALPLALVYAALIVYASLFPFSGWRDQGIAPWAYLEAPWPQYWTRFDLISNLIGYMPLGFLLTLAMLRMARQPWLALTLATLAAAALSFAMECLQSYLPARVASNVDLGFNAAGGLIGALSAAVLERLGAIDRWRRFRARWFVRDSRGALVLLALWPVGLLFPAPVAFGLGQVYERLEEGLAEWLDGTPFLEWLPLRELDLQPLLPGVELVCVALGALVPCLLGYTVIRHRGRRLLFAAMSFVCGVLVTALSAGLSYGPIHAWAWISRPVELGLLAAVFAAALLALVPGRVCVVLLLGVLVAQVVLLNAAPESAYFALTLQSWEQGRFIHFHGLAQWVGWLWPYVTFVYLLSRIGRTDGGQPEPLPAHGQRQPPSPASPASGAPSPSTPVAPAAGPAIDEAAVAPAPVPDQPPAEVPGTETAPSSPATPQASPLPGAAEGASPLTAGPTEEPPLPDGHGAPPRMNS
ncbi:VanZ family protein [Ottowia sp. GY511]|nr:VanZ family protein [Ottowia sp. GY511]